MKSNAGCMAMPECSQLIQIPINREPNGGAQSVQMVRQAMLTKCTINLEMEKGQRVEAKAKLRPYDIWLEACVQMACWQW